MIMPEDALRHTAPSCRPRRGSLRPMRPRDPRAAATDRSILALSLPAFGALAAEPLFLVADSAMVGHLGSAPLAGLAVASSLLQTAVGLMVFLAYATTPSVARRLGAGDRAGALTTGVSGLWLALFTGLALTALGLVVARSLVNLFTNDSAVREAGVSYLLVSLAGIPAMLLVLAGTGVLRGLQDTRTTLLVSGAGFAANIALNAALIYGAGLGVVGSALGTVFAQWGMAAVYTGIVVVLARRAGASIAPHPGLIGAVAVDSWWLFLRTVGLRIGILATVWTTARLGPVETASYQVLSTVFTALSFSFDALGVAAQALLSKAIGSGSGGDEVRWMTRRLIRWGWLSGAACGLLLAALSPVLGRLFSSDPAVLEPMPWALLLMAAGMPLTGFAFLLDGVLIAAGDYRFLAGASTLTSLVLIPALAAILASHADGTTAMLLLWFCYGFIFIGVRALTLGIRVRGAGWLRG